MKKPNNINGDSFFISIWDNCPMWDDWFRIEGCCDLKDAKRIRKWLDRYIAWMEEKEKKCTSSKL